MRFILLVLLGVFLVGCCTAQRRTDPPHPGTVLGWNAPLEKDGYKNAIFVLRKDESTDNGKILVKVLDIIPPDFCAHVGTMQALARAKFQFVRLSDQRVLCEDTSPENGSGSINCMVGVDLYAESNISSMGVMDINLKEGWVYFRISQHGP